MQKLFLVLLAFLIGVTESVAQPAFRNAIFEAGTPWQAGLTVRFEPDEEMCKKHYGRQWRVKCGAPLGQYGQEAKGVKLSPNAAGHWEWQNPNMLAFLPANPQALRPATTYTIDLAGLLLPPQVKLQQTTGQCWTLPLAARIVESNFWVDPAPQGTHRLAMAFEFNFPVGSTSLVPELELPQGGSAGKPELLFNHDRDRLNISWPIVTLPEKAGQAIVKLPGLGQFIQQESARYIPSDKARYVQNLPGAAGLFKITNCSLVTENDSSLNRRQVLQLETSLHTRSEELLAALRIWELPLYNGKGATRAYDWSNSPGISSAVLAQARRVAPVALTRAGSVGGKFRFQIPVAPGRHVLVGVDDLRSASGQRLGQPWHAIVQACPETGRVAFLQPGNILPASGQVGVYGTDIERIDWELQLVEEPFLALLAQSSDDAFQNPGRRTDIALDSLTRRIDGSLPLAPGGEGEARYATLDLGKILTELAGSPSGLSVLTIRGIKDQKECARASKVILATNLGLMVKQDASGQLHCFTRYLEGTAPASGVLITVLGANGRPVSRAQTNADGYAVLPSITGLSREAAPVAVLARKGQQLAWLPLTDKQRVLNLAEYARGTSHVNDRSLLAFVFPQRGLYRPGEMLHFGCMPRMGDFSQAPENLSLYAELLDPRGVTLWHKNFTATGGMADLSWQSSPENLSGSYTLNVRNSKAGPILGSCAFKMEQFQPDTLKFQLVSPKVDGWLVTRKAPMLEARLSTLYGLPAADHKIGGKIRTAQANFQFPRYKGWIFTDPAPFMGQGQERDMDQALTNAEGACSIILPADLFGSASSRIIITAEGFDAAQGRPTIAQTSFLTSPMTQILGYRFAEALTNPDYIPKDTPAALQFLAIDSDLTPVSWKGISFSLHKRTLISSLISDGMGGFRYDEVPQDIPIRTLEDDIPATGKAIELDTGMPGSYVLIARDQAGHILGQIPYTIAGNALQPEDLPLASSKMRLRLNKQAYEPGDSIEVSFNLPYAATGLLSIEREGVHAWKWITANAGENMAAIDLPANFEGQGHVVATFMRHPDSKAVYMAPIAYAAAPFMTNLEGRAMGLKLTAPSKARPGEPLALKISAKKSGTAILYAVDDGILQLTNYKTPDPLAFLLGERGLDVATLQTADLLMPSYGSFARRLAAFGGGTDNTAFGAKFQNPFKRRNEPPVVFWSGVLNVGPEPAPISIPIPAWYAGNLRIIAVGTAEDGAGSAALNCQIAGPLVIEPHLPLAIAPGDRFEGVLTIANNTARDQKVELAVDCGKFGLTNPLPSFLTIPAYSEQVLALPLAAPDHPGMEKIAITASIPGYTLKRPVELSIRPASPLLTTLQTGQINPGAELPEPRAVFGPHARSEITLSAIPLPLASGLARYLETYPYGCAEQLTSRAFGQAILFDWSNAASKERETLFKAAADAIRSRFQEGSGIRLWPQSQPDLLLTAYIADYLLYLREHDLPHDLHLLTQICDTLSWNCALNEPTLEAARASAYAIWILAREGRIVTQLLEDLTRNLQGRVPGWETDLTYVLMAAAMKEMHITSPIHPNRLVYQSGRWFDDYSQAALVTTILARYFPEALTPEAVASFITWSMATLNSNNFSTFAGCMGARALAALPSQGGPSKSIPVCLDGETLELTQNEDFVTGQSAICRKFGIENLTAPLYWEIATTGYSANMPAKAEAHGLEIAREYRDGDGRVALEAALGEVLEVRLTLRANSARVEDCVITDLLPGGLEFVLPAQEKLPKGVKYLDRQEDRLLIFADLTREPLELTYKVRAATKGDFLLPPLAAEAMYDRGIYATGSSGTFRIRGR